MKICSHCKRENADDALFCAYCASPFDEPSASSNRREASVDDPCKTGGQSETAGKTEEPAQTEPGMKIGFIQPEVIQPPVSGEKTPPSTDSRVLPAEPVSPSQPPQFNPGRPDPDSEPPAGEHNRSLILAVAVLAAAALILAGILVYQNIYLPSQTRDAGGDMQTMEEVSDWDFYGGEDADDEDSESASSQRAPIHFRSSDSEVQREKERLSSIDFFEHDSEEEDSSDESSQQASREGTAYLSQYVMKVRDEPSLDGGQIDRIAENQTVYIDRTEKASDGSVWGHLSGGKGWVCIQDSEQDYLTKKEANS